MKTNWVARGLLSGAVMTPALFVWLPVAAQLANISHSYKTNASIQTGFLVSLEPDRSDYVVPATIENADRLFGVAVDANKSLLAADSDTGKVQVATSGSVIAYVSTLNGDIKPGDQIAVTPFEGIGAKSTPGGQVVGLAQTGLNKKTAGAVDKTITDNKKQGHHMYVGLVRLNIGVTTAALSSSTNLNGLQRVTKSLTGHSVPTVRIAVSMTILVVALLAIITLMYTSIYGGIIAIGRNPLAKYAVLRILISILSMAFFMALVAIGAAFILLQ